MKKTVLGILLLCTLLLIRPAAALASGPCCDFCGRDVTFVKLKTYPRYHEFIYWCDSCKMNTRRSASHTGGKATCMEVAVCEVCNQPYGELGAHTGGTATCTERAVCEVCNQPYGEPPAHTGGTGTFTCTTGKICEKCGVEYGILGHAWYWWGEWISAGNGTHTRRCTRCDTVETKDCIGGTATCTAKAVCIKCGKPYGDLAPHTLVTYKRQATCRQEGLEYTRCTAEGCNYRTPDIITPKQHNLKKAREFTREPTCTKPGWNSWYLCQTCTYSETDWVEKLGHDWDKWTPIYDGTNTHTRRCKRCNAEETGSCSGGYADCTSLGMCETCGGSYYGGHTWGEWSSAGNGTHTRSCMDCSEVENESCTGGTGTFTCITGKICEKCGAEYGILGHDWGGWKPISNMNMHLKICNRCNRRETADCGGDSSATCTTQGKCTTCGGQYYGGHDLEQRAAKAPTCTEIGWKAYEACKNCNYTTRKELPALKHDLEQHEAKAPTCTGIGWNAYDTCSRCDYTTYAELPALNHDLVQHAAKAPTCTEIGWNAYETCSRCDYTTYAELPTLNHDLEQHEAKAPTCTEIGWNAYDTCSRCDYTTYAELPALNHALVHHDAQAATCTEKGWNAYDTCSRCDYTTYAELPALNHDYQAVTVAPTCETDGYTVFTCSRCKDSYTTDPTDRLGHQFGAWSPNGIGSQSAGCLRQGCAHTGSTDCRKFTFRTAEGETLIFCPVCGQAENAAQLEKIEAATAWALSGSLSAEDVTARTNGEYLSVAFETAGSLTQPTGRVRLALPAGLLEGKKLVRIAPDGTQTELPFETKRGKLIYTLDFANSELPVMLFRLVPQTAAL